MASCSSQLYHHVYTDDDTILYGTPGVVTSVKDQGSCGSCYTFSATGAIESAYALKTGSVIDLSEQQVGLIGCDTINGRSHGHLTLVCLLLWQVVDCDNFDHGCQGGEMQNVFQYVRQNGGLCKWEDYPYESGKTQTDGLCRSKTCEVGNRL